MKEKSWRGHSDGQAVTGQSWSKRLGFTSMSSHSPHTSFQTTLRAGVELQAGHPGRTAPHLAREATPHFSPLCQGPGGLEKYPSE